MARMGGGARPELRKRQERAPSFQRCRTNLRCKALALGLRTFGSDLSRHRREGVVKDWRKEFSFMGDVNCNRKDLRMFGYDWGGRPGGVRTI